MHPTPASPPATATHEELVRRARELVPALRECAAATEARRSLLPETVDDITASGIHRSLTPACWGGYELGFRTAAETAVELARGCASSAWCAMFVGAHQWLLCHFDEEARSEVLGPDPPTCASRRCSRPPVAPAGRTAAVA